MRTGKQFYHIQHAEQCRYLSRGEVWGRGEGREQCQKWEGRLPHVVRTFWESTLIHQELLRHKRRPEVKIKDIIFHYRKKSWKTRFCTVFCNPIENTIIDLKQSLLGAADKSTHSFESKGLSDGDPPSFAALYRYGFRKNCRWVNEQVSRHLCSNEHFINALHLDPTSMNVVAFWRDVEC